MPLKNILITKYDLNGDVISQETEQVNVEKTVYLNAQFMGKIPANKLKLIKASANYDIEYWWEMVKITKTIDLNNLPTWFVVGLDAMVADGILTQIQVDTFLEI